MFAPTDVAFANHTVEQVNFMVTDKEAAHKLVMQHIMPGTLFSTGMRFYQVRDSLQAGNGITLQKTSAGTSRKLVLPGADSNSIPDSFQAGKVKVNESQIVTPNIPATNGVIHAIDSLL